MGIRNGRKFWVFWGLLGFAILGCPSFAAESPTASVISIDAGSFEVDGQKNILIASGNVIVRQADILLTGDRGVYYQALQKVVVSGNVKMSRDKMLLTCSQATAFGKESRVEVSGNVRFSRLDISGLAGFGVYDQRAQTVQLSGSPKVWQNRDELTGKTILIDIRRSKVSTLGSAKAVFSVDKFSGR